jgi:hypothetical protein
MSETFHLKRGDTSPAIRFVLSPASVELTSAAVVFNMRRLADGTLKVNRASATIVTATGAPTVQYSWQTADTNTAGLYRAEFEVTYLDGKIETFPNADFIIVNIADDIA